MNKKILIGLGFGLGTLGIALSTIQLGLISYSIQKSKEKPQLKAFDEKIYIYALISTYMSNDAKKYFKENIESFLGYKLINNQPKFTRSFTLDYSENWGIFQKPDSDWKNFLPKLKREWKYALPKELINKYYIYFQIFNNDTQYKNNGYWIYK